MLNNKKALLLIGSPKIRKSTSEALGSYLMEGLYKKGFIIETLHVTSILKTDLDEFLEKVNDADILIVSSPLYVDSLPAPMIRALEIIADNRKEQRIDKKQRLAAIINCGFPETLHNEIAIEICKNFSNKARFNWIGGLAMGCGPVINGRPIKQLGSMSKNIVKALDMATDAIVNDEDIPLKAIEVMSKKLFPTWLYILAGNRGWKTQAKQFDAHRLLYDKPYAKG